MADFSTRISKPAQYRRAASRGGQNMLRALHLVGGGAAYLPHCLQQVVDAVDIALAQQTTMRVHRQAAVERDISVPDEILRLAPAAKAVRLQRHMDDG